jgi:hypothetical protein
MGLLSTPQAAVPIMFGSIRYAGDQFLIALSAAADSM